MSTFKPEGGALIVPRLLLGLGNSSTEQGGNLECDTNLKASLLSSLLL